jgi:hypothetical protein
MIMADKEIKKAMTSRASESISARGSDGGNSQIKIDSKLGKKKTS